MSFTSLSINGLQHLPLLDGWSPVYDVDIIPGLTQKSKACRRCHTKKIQCIFPTGEPVCQQCKQHGIKVCVVLDVPVGK